MPSDKCNLTMAKATGLIFLLFDITSDRDVPLPFFMDLTSALLYISFIFAHHKKCQFSGRHMIASIYN